MVDLLNGAAAKMEGLQPDEKDLARSAATTKEMSALATATVKQLETLELGDDGLKKHAADYKQVLQDMAKGTADMAGFMEEMAQLETQSSGAANAKLESTRAEIEKLCKKATEECRKITQVMAMVPSDAGAGELPTVLGRYAEQLKGLELGDALGTSVKSHIEAVEAFVQIVKRADELQTKADAGQSELDAVISREEKLVAAINTYCVGTPSP